LASEEMANPKPRRVLLHDELQSPKPAEFWGLRLIRKKNLTTF